MVVNCEASDHSWRLRLNIHKCETTGYLSFFSRPQPGGHCAET